MGFMDYSRRKSTPSTLSKEQAPSLWARLEEAEGENEARPQETSTTLSISPVSLPICCVCLSIQSRLFLPTQPLTFQFLSLRVPILAAQRDRLTGAESQFQNLEKKNMTVSDELESHVLTGPGDLWHGQSDVT